MSIRLGLLGPAQARLRHDIGRFSPDHGWLDTGFRRLVRWGLFPLSSRLAVAPIFPSASHKWGRAHVEGLRRPTVAAEFGEERHEARIVPDGLEERVTELNGQQRVLAYTSFEPVELSPNLGGEAAKLYVTQIVPLNTPDLTEVPPPDCH